MHREKAGERKTVRLLVTGGAGYIGSVVLAELLRSGHQAVVYDNLSHGYAESLPKHVELIRGDVNDRARLDDVFQRHSFDAVLHFAALIEAGESMRVPEQYFRNNSVGSLTLLETMLAHSVRQIVFSSTAAVYGNPENVPIHETHALRPTNAYGESKLVVEQMLAWLHRVHGLRYASLRYFNAAGATEELGEAHVPESHLIPLVLQVAQNIRPTISIFGTDYPTSDGSCVRDYIHVLDLARAHVLALEALGKRDQLIYNLGNGRGYSVREVIEVARAVTGHKILAIEAPRRPGDPAVLVASSEKIRTELGWEPRLPELADIVGSAWRWLQRRTQSKST
jgi:UDP-glucose 4-epimerase